MLASGFIFSLLSHLRESTLCTSQQKFTVSLQSEFLVTGSLVGEQPKMFVWEKHDEFAEIA